MTEQSPEILTIEEAADYLRVPLSSLYRIAQSGRIPCQKVGRHWRFRRQALERWIEGNAFLQDGKKRTAPESAS
jgi:excisionase family DNA binding protein